jgi:signal transduction histidine kinase
LLTRSKLHFLLQGIVLAVLYFGFARFGSLIRSITGLSSFIWIPDGLGLSALVLLNIRLWPFIFLPGLIASFVLRHSFPAALLVAAGHTFSCWLGAVLLQRYVGPRPTISKVREALVFEGLAVGLSAGLGSAISVTGGLLAEGRFTLSAFISGWSPLWLAGALGMLLVSGTLISWQNYTRYKLSSLRASMPEGLILAVLTITLSVSLYTSLGQNIHSLLVRPYMLYILVGWATIRFELLGATLTVLVVGLIETYGIYKGYVYPSQASPSDRMLLQQTYILNLGMVSLVLGAALREREDALQARSEFLSIASHELRAPVAAAGLQLQLFQKQIANNGTQLSPQQLNTLDRANKQMKRMGHTLEQLLDFSRIDRKDLQLNLTRFDLAELIHDVTERISAEATRARCSISVQLEPGLQCEWDPFRIEQVLVNLVSNAIKYAPGGPIHIRSIRSEGQIEICVEDQGRGIAKSIQPYVFDRFVRASDMTDVKGLGLGLFISRQIVEAHHGRIWVDSDLDEGTRFYVRIPPEFGKKENGAESPSESE